MRALGPAWQFSFASVCISPLTNQRFKDSSVFVMQNYCQKGHTERERDGKKGVKFKREMLLLKNILQVKRTKSFFFILKKPTLFPFFPFFFIFLIVVENKFPLCSFSRLLLSWYSFIHSLVVLFFFYYYYLGYAVRTLCIKPFCLFFINNDRGLASRSSSEELFIIWCPCQCQCPPSLLENISPTLDVLLVGYKKWNAIIKYWGSSFHSVKRTKKEVLVR